MLRILIPSSTPVVVGSVWHTKSATMIASETVCVWSIRNTELSPPRTCNVQMVTDWARPKTTASTAGTFASLPNGAPADPLKGDRMGVEISEVGPLRKVKSAIANAQTPRID